MNRTLLLYYSNGKYVVVAHSGRGIYVVRTPATRVSKYCSWNVAMRSEQLARVDQKPLAWDFVVNGEYFSDTTVGLLIAVAEVSL